MASDNKKIKKNLSVKSVQNATRRLNAKRPEVGTVIEKRNDGKIGSKYANYIKKKKQK